MSRHVKIALVLVILGLLAVGIANYILPLFTDAFQKETSDARDMRGKIVLGYDNWVGYFPMCSPEMKRRLRRSGYLLECQDDQANYAERFERLRNGSLNMAVATVDSYLLGGARTNFPGSIVMVIDESKGGDAVVAWKDKVDSIDAMKSNAAVKVAFTPSSPSEHLLKAMSVHFDIPQLRARGGDWRVESDGSSDALKRLLNKEVQVAALWEPDVSRALATEGVKKLLGTEDTDKLIVDILLVSRSYLKKDPDAVKVFLSHYFRTLKYYRDSPERLAADLTEVTDLSTDQATTLLTGVDWKTLQANCNEWFGVNTQIGVGLDGLVDTVYSAVEILIESGDFPDTPVPDGDPYRLLNSTFVDALCKEGLTAGTITKVAAQSPAGAAVNTLEKTFNKLNPEQWDRLEEVGTLRVRPIVFQRGTARLSTDGKQELDKAIENLRHYPNFRILISGHTEVRGDPAANLELSQDRADAVARYLSITYGIDENRILAKGYGGTRPLPRKPGESIRSYGYRLPRVELSLVSEVY